MFLDQLGGHFAPVFGVEPLNQPGRHFAGALRVVSRGLPLLVSV
jgi:hypothetical protein